MALRQRLDFWTGFCNVGSAGRFRHAALAIAAGEYERHAALTRARATGVIGWLFRLTSRTADVEVACFRKRQGFLDAAGLAATVMAEIGQHAFEQHRIISSSSTTRTTLAAGRARRSTRLGNTWLRHHFHPVQPHNAGRPSSVPFAVRIPTSRTAAVTRRGQSSISDHCKVVKKAP